MKVWVFLGYVATVFLANWLVAEVGIVSVLGLLAPAGVFAAGLALALRDTLHELGGRWWVLGGILLGAACSYLLGDGRIALASGAAFLFSELSLYGRWTLSPADYAREVRRYRDEIGGLDYAAPQDWMCEPPMLAKTGKTIREHQARTVGNYLELLSLAPDLPWIPVLQGWTLGDYYACWDRYERAGIDLTTLPMVGLGTVCRRQGMAEATEIVGRLADEGVRLHGFGFKLTGLAKVGGKLAAADSMAWSYAARRSPPLPGCTTHINCANCHHYALKWLKKVQAIVG